VLSTSCDVEIRILELGFPVAGLMPCLIFPMLINFPLMVFKEAPEKSNLPVVVREPILACFAVDEALGKRFDDRILQRISGPSAWNFVLRSLRPRSETIPCASKTESPRIEAAGSEVSTLVVIRFIRARVRLYDNGHLSTKYLLRILDKRTSDQVWCTPCLNWK